MHFSRLTLAVVVVLSAVSTLHAADKFKVDPVHSQVVFQVSHADVSKVLGRVNEPTGEFTLDDGDPSKSTFDISVPAKNVDTGFQKRDEHLRGPDFFNAKQFPDIKFKSTAVKKLDDGSYEFAGDLTLHGETKPITVKVEKINVKDVGAQMGGVRAGFDTTFTIKRSDFGMNTMQGPVGDEVKLMINIEGTKE